MMKQLLVSVALLTAVSITAVSGTAMAADLSRPPPAPVYKAPPMVPVFSWTGFYIGGNLGGAWGHGTVTDTFNGLSFGGNSNNGVFIGGGQAGFNYQVSNIVFGVEGDFDWAANNNNSSAGIVIPGGNIIQVTANNRWISTVAGRLGVAWDRVLFYGKGGGAWVGNNSFTVADLTTGASVSGGSSNTTGWLAGVGLEWAFWNNWTARVEYNYIGLSSRSFTVPVGTPLLGGLGGDTFNTGSNNVQTVTVGINYLFNLGGPVVARY